MDKEHIRDFKRRIEVEAIYKYLADLRDELFRLDLEIRGLDQFSGGVRRGVHIVRSLLAEKIRTLTHEFDNHEYIPCKHND